MLQGWTYKQKTRAVLIAGAIFLVLAYMLSIRKTIAVYREASLLESQSELAANAPTKAVELEKRLAEIDNLLGMQPRAGNVQQALLGVITGYCKEHNTVLREFPKTVYNEEKDFMVETNVFTVEGNFFELLKLVYLLEQENRIGKISSARFFVKKDLKTHTTGLNATIYLQNIKKPEHEK